VSADDVAAWKRFRGLGGRAVAELPLRDEVEPVVLMRVLERRFDALPEPIRREHALRWRHYRLALAETRLRDRVRVDVAATEEEIRRAFEADPGAYAQPRLWQLENILKRFPEGATAEERAVLRQAMERIREKVAAGEDFAALAKRESESETRLLGGSAGAVGLEGLAPEVAAVVSRLKKGDLSPIIETREGLTLLRCVDILEPQPPSLDRARRVVSLRLGEERFPPAWEALTARLEADLEAAYPSAEPSQGPSGEAVASYRSGDGRDTVTREDFLLFVSDTQGDPAGLPAESLRESLQHRVRLEGYLKEAERRGLLSGPDDALLFEWKEREMRARAVERAEVEAGVPPPTDEQVRAAFAARPQAFTAPARVTLKALKIAVARDRPRSFYEKARRIGERAASSDLPFEDAAAALQPHAERVELGTLTADELWLMGRKVDTAVKATPVGGTTPLVQEGRTLWIFHVAAREAERTLSFEEARDGIRQALHRAARRKAVAEFRNRILEEQAVALIP
jgi:parvulin-like peptidyl-prolyl isomerase